MIAHHGKTLPAGLGRLTRLPEPVRTAFAYAVIAALAAGLGEVGMVRFHIWAAVVAAAGIGGGGAVAWSHVRRQQRFWVADAWIAHRRGERPAEEVLRERSAILVSPRHRGMVAHSLRRTVADAEGRPGRTARVAVEPATCARARPSCCGSPTSSPIACAR